MKNLAGESKFKYFLWVKLITVIVSLIMPFTTFAAPCTPGQFSATGNDPCTACDPGTFADLMSSTTCTPCPPGRFQAAAGASSCPSCLPGTFQDSSGAASCQNCTAGTFQDTAASTSCTACAAGTVSSAGSTTCESCPAGQVADADATACSTPASTNAPSVTATNSGGCGMLPAATVNPISSAYGKSWMVSLALIVAALWFTRSKRNPS